MIILNNNLNTGVSSAVISAQNLWVELIVIIWNNNRPSVEVKIAIQNLWTIIIMIIYKSLKCGNKTLNQVNKGVFKKAISAQSLWVE